ALRLDGKGVAVLAQPPGDPARGRAHEHDRLVRAGVEGRCPGSAGAVRQRVDPAAHPDAGLAATTLLERSLTRAPAGEAVDVRRPSDDDQIDVLEARERLVDRDDLRLPLRRQRTRYLLGDTPGVSEPRLVDH